jgi:hypothetical protein
MHNKLGAFAYEMFYGEKGSGKTLSIVAVTHEDLKRTQAKLELFSNFDLTEHFFKGLNITKKDNFHLIKKQDLEILYKEKILFKNSIFLIDEFHTWLDSRNFAKNYNKAFFYFVGQLRKRGNVLRGTSHDKSLIDIRGRLYQEVEIYCFKGLVNDKRKWKLCLNYTREFSLEEQRRMYVKLEYYVRKLIRDKSYLPEFVTYNTEKKLVKAIDYFKMYDTEEYII